MGILRNIRVATGVVSIAHLQYVVADSTTTTTTSPGPEIPFAASSLSVIESEGILPASSTTTVIVGGTTETLTSDGKTTTAVVGGTTEVFGLPSSPSIVVSSSPSVPAVVSTSGSFTTIIGGTTLKTASDGKSSTYIVGGSTEVLPSPSQSQASTGSLVETFVDPQDGQTTILPLPSRISEGNGLVTLTTEGSTLTLSPIFPAASNSATPPNIESLTEPNGHTTALTLPAGVNITGLTTIRTDGAIITVGPLHAIPTSANVETVEDANGDTVILTLPAGSSVTGLQELTTDGSTLAVFPFNFLSGTPTSTMTTIPSGITLVDDLQYTATTDGYVTSTISGTPAVFPVIVPCPTCIPVIIEEIDDGDEIPPWGKLPINVVFSWPRWPQLPKFSLPCIRIPFTNIHVGYCPKKNPPGPKNQGSPKSPQGRPPTSPKPDDPTPSRPSGTSPSSPSSPENSPSSGSEPSTSAPSSASESNSASTTSASSSSSCVSGSDSVTNAVLSISGTDTRTSFNVVSGCMATASTTTVYCSASGTPGASCTPLATAQAACIVTKNGTSMETFQAFVEKLDNNTGTQVAYPKVDFQLYVSNLTSEQIEYASSQPFVLVAAPNTPWNTTYSEVASPDGTTMATRSSATMARMAKNEGERSIDDFNSTQAIYKRIDQVPANLNSIPDWNRHLNQLRMLSDPKELGEPQTPQNELDLDYLFDPTQGRGAWVYVVDSGFNLNHQAFTPGSRQIQTWFPQNNILQPTAGQTLTDPSIEDLGNHGTGVAALAAGAQVGDDGDVQTIGVVPNANLFLLKDTGNCKDAAGNRFECGSCASSIFAAYMKILDHVANRGNDGATSVINYSVTTPRDPMWNGLWSQIVTKIEEADILLVLPTGNNGLNLGSLDQFMPQFYGSLSPNILTVGGVTPFGQLWPATTMERGMGGSISCYAQAADVWEADAANPPYGVVQRSGTSAAAPIVAGIAAYFGQLPSASAIIGPLTRAYNLKIFILGYSRMRSNDPIPPTTQQGSADTPYSLPQGYAIPPADSIKVPYNLALNELCATRPPNILPQPISRIRRFVDLARRFLRSGSVKRSRITARQSSSTDGNPVEVSGTIVNSTFWGIACPATQSLPLVSISGFSSVSQQTATSATRTLNESSFSGSAISTTSLPFCTGTLAPELVSSARKAGGTITLLQLGTGTSEPRCIATVPSPTDGTASISETTTVPASTSSSISILPASTTSTPSRTTTSSTSTSSAPPTYGTCTTEGAIGCTSPGDTTPILNIGDLVGADDQSGDQIVECTNGTWTVKQYCNPPTNTNAPSMVCSCGYPDGPIECVTG